MTDTVASLGFAVDSKPLDDAKIKLAGVETQAKATGRAVDDFNQSASKWTNSYAQAASAASGAEKAFGPVVTAISAQAAALKASADAARAFGPVVLGANAAVVAHTAAVNNAANAHAGFTTQNMAAFHSLRSLTEQAAAGQLSFQSLGQQFSHLSYAATGPGGLTAAFAPLAKMIGPTGLFAAGAVGVTALAFALTKVGDEVGRSEKLFEGLTGSSASGKAALNAAKDAARGAGFELGVMASGLQKAIQGQAEFASKTVIYANAADKAGKDAAHLSEAFGTLGKIMQQAGGTEEEEKAVFDAIGTSIQKTGSLTKEAFQKIIDVSPIAALRISQAFGSKNIKEFQDELEKTPLALDDMLRVLDQIKPKVDAIKWDPTIEQQIRQVESAWHSLVDSFGNAGGFKLAKDILDTISGALRQDATDITGLASALSSLGQMASSVLSNVMAAINAAAAAVGGSSGNDTQAANQQFVNAFNNDPVSRGGFDESGFEGGFATGGSFVVGGDGGTDTTNVSFKATKGEVVTIATPDQAATAAALTPVSSTTDIEDLLKEQTKAIVDAINGLKTPTAVATTATAAVAAVAAGGAGGGGTTAFGAGGSSGGGGGGGSQTPFKQLEQEQQKRQAELDARERELGGGGNFAGGSGVAGLVGGQAVALRGFLPGRGGTFPTRTPTGEFAPFGTGPDANGIIKVPQVEKNTNETNRRLNEANQSLDDVGRATASTTRGVESGARDTVSAIGASTSTIADAIRAGLNAVGSAMQESSMTQGGQGGASGGGGGGPSSFSGSGDSSYSGSDYTGGAGFVDSFGLPTGSGFGGASSGLYNGNNGSFDFTPLDQSQMGSSSFDESGFAGSFARGGSFIAGGDGGTDTTPIRFFATKGERIDITPAGVKTPSGVKVPSSMLRPGDASSRPVQHVTTHNKNVTIQVQAGISADTILRSRAQIARSM